MCDLAVWELLRRMHQLNIESLVVVVINSSLVTDREEVSRSNSSLTRS